MELALTPHTAAGMRLVALAEQHAADFARRAEQYDREGSSGNIAALQQSGVLAACVPEEFGGLGSESLYDTTVGVNRGLLAAMAPRPLPRICTSFIPGVRHAPGVRPRAPGMPRKPSRRPSCCNR